MTAPHRIAVVGAGASGALVAIRLLERAGHPDGAGVDLRLVDAAEATGRGVAYATDDLRHRLNVPAGRMSAHPGDPHHFADWLAARQGGEPQPDAYAARGSYGQYLGETLALAAAQAGNGRLNRVRDRAVGIAGDHAGVRIALGSGRSWKPTPPYWRWATSRPA